MQILANALPGFRDLRAPVVAGYLWLFFAWLIADPDISHRPGNSLGGATYDLFHSAGHVWIAVAAGVAAYFVGAISQDISRGLRASLLLFSYRFGPRFQLDNHEQLERSYDRGRQIVERSTPWLDPPQQRELRALLDDRHKEARFEAERELDLPATLLVGDQAELFAEVDRLRAEGELRMAVVPPLVALTILLGIAGSFWWSLLFVPIAMLFRQGVERDFDSKKSIADAIRVGRAKSSGVVKFSKWVEEKLPAEVTRLRQESAP